VIEQGGQRGSVDAIIRDLIEARPQAALALIAQHCRDRADADLTIVATAAGRHGLRAEITLGGARHRTAAVDVAGRPVALGATVAGLAYAAATPTLATVNDEPEFGLRLDDGPFHGGSAMVIPLCVAGEAEALIILVRAAPASGYADEDLTTLSTLATVAYAAATALRERVHEARLDERERIAARLRRELVETLYSAALTLHQVAFRTARQADLDRLVGVIDTIDDVVKRLRKSAFTAAPIAVTALRDSHSGVITATVAGHLSMETAPAVRAALLKLAAEGPPALLLDLAALDEPSADRMSALAAVTRTARKDYDVPVMMFGAAPGVARALHNFRVFATLFRDEHEALAAARQATPQWARTRLGIGPPAAAEARELLGNCCLEWGVPELLTNARAIVSELVESAVRRGGSELEITVSANADFLRLAVRDRGLPASPEVEAHDLGPLVDTAANWSVTPMPDGRIVWAVLRIDPRHDD
jgi:anti-anti-sigma regulatory factor